MAGQGGANVRRWTLAITSASFFMVVLDSQVIQVALPAIHRELGGGVSVLGWIMNAYLLTLAAGIVTAAALGDRYGRRLVYQASLLLFTIASLACALSPSVPLLIGARAAQGVGAAAIFPLSLSILTSTFPAARRGAVIGIWSAIAGVGAASGPFIGGALTQGLSWHAIFWLNVPIGVVAAVLARTQLSETHGGPSELDPIGVALAITGSGLAAYGLMSAPRAGWSDWHVVAALASGVGLIVTFVFWEARARAPMMPLRLFGSPGFSVASAIGFLMVASSSTLGFLLAQYFQLGRGYSPLASGLSMVPLIATILVIGPIAGRLADRVGPRSVLLLGFSIQTCGELWIATIARASTSYLELIAPLILAGVGISLTIPTAPTAAVNAVAPADIGKASGVFSMLQRFGAAFGIAIATSILALGDHFGTASGVVVGFRLAITVCAVISIIAALAALAIPTRRGSELEHDFGPSSQASG